MTPDQLRHLDNGMLLLLGTMLTCFVVTTYLLLDIYREIKKLHELGTGETSPREINET